MKNKRENGELVVEASIIVTLVVIFMTIMLYVTMVLYQQTLVSVMARQTASNIAQVYSNSIRDPFTGYIDSDKVYQSATYDDMKTDAYLDAIEQKANVFAKYRLQSSRILPAESTSVEVEIAKKPNELLKSQIIVTIHQSYRIPLIGLFTKDKPVEFAASGRADCVDLLEYLNGVAAIGDPDNSAIQFLPGSDVCLVTFVVDKYSGGFHAAVPVMRGESIMSSNRVSHSTMPAEPVNNGMKFTGWTTEDGSSFTASNKINENITVYGNWECLVTFDPDGGTVTPASKTVGIRKTTLLPEPKKDHSSFEGWYTEKNGGGVQYHSNVTEITSNVTLYAKWSCIHDYVEGNVTNADKVNCSTHILYEGVCKYCGAISPEPIEGDLGKRHSFDINKNDAAGCGITHTFCEKQVDYCGNGGEMNQFQCIVCRFCGELYLGKSNLYEYGSDKPIAREIFDENGNKVTLLNSSTRMWCITHFSQEDLETLPVHELKGGHEFK